MAIWLSRDEIAILAERDDEKVHVEIISDVVAHVYDSISRMRTCHLAPVTVRLTISVA